MGSTPNLALPYPELSDNADVPQDIRALADKLDAILGGGSGGGGGGTLPLAAAPVLAVGMAGQVRAGRQLATSDFTSMGLSVPAGLFNLGGLTNLGGGGPLVNLGAVPFGVGINGAASSAAVFAGSTGQALYIADTGAADPFRIRTGSWGCWFRTAKRATNQYCLAKTGAASLGWALYVNNAEVMSTWVSTTGADQVVSAGVSTVTDDRWHFAVVTCDATALRIYVDGVLEGVTSMAATIFGPAMPLDVGAYAADGSTAAISPHYGRVDEAFVTADVLTDDQIRLLYCTRLAHSLGTIPGSVRMAVHRRRKGAAYAVADFAAQPIRLHNFTGGALTDQGSGGVALAPVGGGSIVDVAGADGTPLAAKSFSGAHTGLGATDAGLPGGLTTRSYGAWFKATGQGGLSGWGTLTGNFYVMTRIASNGAIVFENAGDGINGPYVADGQWHLFIVTEDNTAGDGVKRKGYLDGRLVGGSTVMGSITLGGANRFRVGTWPDGTNPLTGQIDAAFVTGYAIDANGVAALYAKGTQDLGASPKSEGDHVERVDATSVLFIADTLESQHTVDLGVAA